MDPTTVWWITLGLLLGFAAADLMDWSKDSFASLHTAVTHTQHRAIRRRGAASAFTTVALFFVTWGLSQVSFVVVPGFVAGLFAFAGLVAAAERLTGGDAA